MSGPMSTPVIQEWMGRKSRRSEDLWAVAPPMASLANLAAALRETGHDPREDHTDSYVLMMPPMLNTRL
eukprot:1123488-Amphidinium_carterae.1